MAPPFGARRQARARALQVLYALEYATEGPDVALRRYWITLNGDERLAKDFPKIRDYAEALVRGVLTHQVELDTALSLASPNWRLDRMGAVDRAVMRIAAFELLHSPDVPRAVAIDEAIELARTYGDAESPAFVNGILDHLRVPSLTPRKGRSRAVPVEAVRTRKRVVSGVDRGPPAERSASGAHEDAGPSSNPMIVGGSP